MLVFSSCLLKRQNLPRIEEGLDRFPSAGLVGSRPDLQRGVQTVG
jgi:hypothetical protein